MHVIFVEPAFPSNQAQFVRGLHEAGARVTGIGEAPLDALPTRIRHWLYKYEQVPSVVHEPSMLDAVRRVQAREWVDRMEATVEAHVEVAARVREQTGIPGTSVHTTYLCRDKPAMKEALRAAGVACAQSIGSGDTAEVREFAKRVGYPLILKPRDGAGAAGTYKVSDDSELEAALGATGVLDGHSVAVEEFIEGHEAFYDTIAIDGEVAADFVSHYYPNVLEGMRTRWISPQFIATNRVDAASDYAEVREMGKRVIDALGIRTSATHMEWFFGPKGLKFSEIGCRPPGVGAWDLYRAGNEFDIYTEWANAIVHGRLSSRPSRAMAAGMIALRPDRDGTIVGYEGLEEIEQRFEPWFIDSHIPPVGSRTQPVEGGFMANAWIRLRHPDYDELRSMLNTVGERVQVRAR